MSASVDAIVLAAGNSARLGRNKQLVELDGEPLVKRAAKAALAALAPRGGGVVVVTGFEAEKVAAAVGGLPCTVVDNTRWQEGMGGSLSVALAALQRLSPVPQAVLVVLPDQYKVDASHLAALLARLDASPKGIIATGYSGTAGAPALFRAKYFGALAALPPSAGAKRLISAHQVDVDVVVNEAAVFDLDRPEDLKW